ncbi:NADPH-dependent FMN reductase [Sphingobium sp. SA916]|uniref:NADPH-dependent FMN reductase n=1 Tax=Sphingobium sp. SA916 TaxID=1851207 RepID=UPI000C9F3B0D|nr:NAD(P)H-dependent oxidoreductase [Sphingobium sp. SA916]PNP96829.1 hypothetical protein A8G00_22830 [Sphingobium sp. SA916]
MKLGLVVGDTKPRSRTLKCAIDVCKLIDLSAPHVIVDIVDIGEELFSRNSPVVKSVIMEIQDCNLVMFASPTINSSYSGILKLLLDQFPPRSLEGVVAIPVMVGGDASHGIDPDFLLKPILVEMGATCPARGLHLVESTNLRSSLSGWLNASRVLLSSVPTHERVAS